MYEVMTVYDPQQTLFWDDDAIPTSKRELGFFY